MGILKPEFRLSAKLLEAVSSANVFIKYDFRLRGNDGSLVPDVSYYSLSQTTETDIIYDPAVDYQILIDQLEIYNSDTITHTIIFYLNDRGNSSYIPFHIDSIEPNSSLHYSRSTGWSKTADSTKGFAINVQALTSSPTDAQTVYFGTLPKAPVTAANTSKVYIPKACRAKRAEVYCYSGTPGTAEAWSLYLRKNNSEDFLIQTLSVAQSERKFQNSLLDVPFNAGDYFEIKGVQPTWVTNPATTIYGGYVYFE